MSEMLERLADRANTSVAEARMALGVLDLIGPDALVPVLVEQQRKQLESEDLTPNEREWMDIFIASESYETMWYELLSEYGVERAVEIMYEISQDQDNDLNYYSYLVDEDPERIAAIYATEVLERYVYA